MSRIPYINHNFTPRSLQIIEVANIIIGEYVAKGFNLTLRQLFYQFVARGILPNEDREYHSLGKVINKARLSGRISWEAIDDRTRFMRSAAHWDSAEGVMQAAVDAFRVDRWERQDCRPEIWIEKDALIGLIENVCSDLDVPFFSCRGYTSQSAMWRAAQRMQSYMNQDQVPMIFHLADHDPSGLDMSEDILQRMDVFGVRDYLEYERLGLNIDQVQQYNPPPNPTKLSDSRTNNYRDQYGSECWELDSMDPDVIIDLVENAILNVRDDDIWDEDMEKENDIRMRLQRVTDNWSDVDKMLDEKTKPPKKKSKKPKRRKVYRWKCENCGADWTRRTNDEPKLCSYCRDKGAKSFLGEEWIEG